MFNSYAIYTDGAFRREPLVTGGWAALVVTPTGNLMYSGHCEPKDALEAELRAVVNGLGKIPPNAEVHLYCDNSSVVDGLQGTANKSNRQQHLRLWKRLRYMTAHRRVHAHWVRSHDGNHYNELVDMAARQAAHRGKNVKNNRNSR